MAATYFCRDISEYYVLYFINILILKAVPLYFVYTGFYIQAEFVVQNIYFVCTVYINLTQVLYKLWLIMFSSVIINLYVVLCS